MVLYGHLPRHFGIQNDYVVPMEDLVVWLKNREVAMKLIQQHLLRAQDRMKRQADKHRTERVFQVGEFVYLKLQHYMQSSIATHANQILAF